MDQLTIWNVAAYSAQVVSIAALAGLAMTLLRIDVAVARYWFWRAVLALCLVLPLVQGRQVTVAEKAHTTSIETQATVTPTAVPVRSGPRFDWAGVVIPVLAAGVAARLLWIGLSLVRLRRLRRLGDASSGSAILSELQQIIGTSAEVRYVARLRQPVTFGLWRPVILLPASLAAGSEDVQRAVLSHELFHVKRRDWGWLLAEEIVCALLWFNPAVWWLVSRVQLAREVVVDELAVLATGRRRAYIQALVTFADETSIAPVAAFGGRRQLFNRIVLLSKEAVMSSRRLVVTCGVLAVAVAAGTWQAVGAFPLTAAPQQQAARPAGPGPMEQRSVPITPENPVPKRTNYEPAGYPDEARVAGAYGSVTVRITLDELGRVAEARRTRLTVASGTPQATVAFAAANPADEARFVINGSREDSDTIRRIAYAFEEAALRSVQQWRYDPPASGPISFEVTVNFSDGPVGSVPPRVARTQTLDTDGALRIGGGIKTPVKIKDVRPVYPPIAQQSRVSGIVILEIRVAADGSVQDALVLRSIPLLDQAAIDAVMQWKFQPTLLNGNPVPVIMTVTVNFALQSGAARGQRTPVVPATEVEPEGPKPQAAPKKQMPTVLKDVKPLYPKIAMDAAVEGIVEMSVTIGTDGKVVDARVTRSIPLLDQAALDAVRQWIFTPIPQQVDVDIEMSFALRSKR